MRKALIVVPLALLAGGLMILPTLGLGAMFPITMQGLGSVRGSTGRVVGWAYALNTLGAIAGSVLAGFLLVPRWGSQSTLLAGIGYRTNLEGVRQLQTLAGKDVEVIWFDMPHYKGRSDVFHLMSTLSPVDKDLAVAYPPLMAARQIELTQSGPDLGEIVSRGVLLDIPALKGVEVLAPGTPITAGDLHAACQRQNVEVCAGDAVLIRSGWPVHWSDAHTFVGHEHGVPGPDESAAAWLIERQIRLTGAETIAYECIYPERGHALLPVHRMLLVESGIHIIEVLDLTELARAQVSEFLFVVTPLKIVGATGVPVRPVAVVA